MSIQNGPKEGWTSKSGREILVIFMTLLILLLRDEVKTRVGIWDSEGKGLLHMKIGIWERILFVPNTEECIVLLCMLLIIKNM